MAKPDNRASPRSRRRLLRAPGGRGEDRPREARGAPRTVPVPGAQGRPVGTYIFDEVDAGVGGKAAIEVGKRLHALAASSQVIVVTHLPQVAAWADTHFVVRKSSDGSVVASGVSRCEGEERIEEIARMLAGLEESISAREHAAELLALRG